jgi:hypothetical protein
MPHRYPKHLARVTVFEVLLSTGRDASVNRISCRRRPFRRPILRFLTDASSSAALAGSQEVDPHAATLPLAYEFAFPEVFYPDGHIEIRSGFDVVFGNPPWDRMLPADKEFFAGFDFSILDVPTKRERTDIQKRLSSDPDIQAAHKRYLAEFRADEEVLDRSYRYQVVQAAHQRGWNKCDTRSVSAPQIEGAVVYQLRNLVRDPAVLSEVLQRLAENRPPNEPMSDPAEIQTAQLRFDPLWEQLTTAEQETFIRTVVHQVKYDGTTGEVTIGFHSDGIRQLCSPTSNSRR